MSDAKTQVADVFVPEMWAQWFIERSVKTNKFSASGIAVRSGEMDALAAGPGKTVDMPFWQDISGDRQIISDTNAFEKRKIASAADQARIHNDGNAWSTTLLARLLSSEEGMDAIVNLIGDYWAREDEAMLVASLKGVLLSLDAESGDPNLAKLAAESTGATAATTILSGDTFIDAKQKLGDRKDLLTAICMHSAVEADLLKQDLITFIPDSDGKPSLPTFQGLRVITDDEMPKRAGTSSGFVYTTVLFGAGAIALGSAALNTPVEGGFGTDAVERTRVPLNHDAVLINRRRMIKHPRGIKWLEASVTAAGGPTNTELALAANWDLVYDQKNVRMVFITHNLSSQIPAGS